MIKITDISQVLYYIDGLDAVIFDLDDTLCLEKEYVSSGYDAVAKILPQIKNVKKKLWDYFLKKKNAIDELLKGEGIYSDELHEKCLQAYRQHVPQLNFISGACEVLRAIREKGLKIGVITEGRPCGQRAKIKALKLNNYVDEIIIADELGGVSYRKPNPYVFEYMAKKLKCDVKKMCYIGDNISKDLIAPEKLGMRAIYFINKDGIYYKPD